MNKRLVDVYQLSHKRQMLEGEYMEFINWQPLDVEPAASIIREGYGLTPRAIVGTKAPVQRFVDPHGRETYICMSPELRVMLDECLESEKVARLENELDGARARACALEARASERSEKIYSLLAERDDFLALPWYRRIWRALRGEL